MTNAEQFKRLFEFTATELWSLPEEQFLKWLNEDVAENVIEEMLKSMLVELYRRANKAESEDNG